MHQMNPLIVEQNINVSDKEEIKNTDEELRDRDDDE